MSRIRTIKPDFWSSEQIISCPPLARILFIGMWNFCDDAGIHPNSLIRLKAEIFPCDNISIEEINVLVVELMKNDLIFEFEHKGKKYFQVRNFLTHQVIKKPTYKYLTRNELENIGFNTNLLQRPDLELLDPPGMEWNGREWKGKEIIPLIPLTKNSQNQKTQKKHHQQKKHENKHPGINFEKFISAYPKIVDQLKIQKAAQTWVFEKCDFHFAKIMKSISDRVSFSDWREKIGTDNQKYIPDPATFLREKYFEKDFEKVLSFDDQIEIDKEKLNQEFENGDYN